MGSLLIDLKKCGEYEIEREWRGKGCVINGVGNFLTFSVGRFGSNFLKYFLNPSLIFTPNLAQLSQRVGEISFSKYE